MRLRHRIEEDPAILQKLVGKRVAEVECALDMLLLSFTPYIPNDQPQRGEKLIYGRFALHTDSWVCTIGGEVVTDFQRLRAILPTDESIVSVCLDGPKLTISTATATFESCLSILVEVGVETELWRFFDHAVDEPHLICFVGIDENA